MDNEKFVEASAQEMFAPKDTKGFSFDEGFTEAHNVLKKVMEKLNVSNEPVKIIVGAVRKESGTPVIDIRLSIMISNHSTDVNMLIKASSHVIQKQLKNIAHCTALSQVIFNHSDDNKEQGEKECSK